MKFFSSPSCALLAATSMVLLAVGCASPATPADANANADANVDADANADAFVQDVVGPADMPAITDVPSQDARAAADVPSADAPAIDSPLVDSPSVVNDQPMACSEQMMPRGVCDGRGMIACTMWASANAGGSPNANAVCLSNNDSGCARADRCRNTADVSTCTCGGTPACAVGQVCVSVGPASRCQPIVCR